MTTLNDAHDVHLGADAVRVWLDGVVVWPPHSYGESLYGRWTYGDRTPPLAVVEHQDEERRT
jgi:hypothetical protein